MPRAARPTPAAQSTSSRSCRAVGEHFGAAGELFAESGKMPQISVRVGEGVAVINEYLEDHPEVAALVLGAAAEGNPGPLISHFSAHAGNLRCPLFIVPGGLSDEEIDRVS